MTCRTLAGVLLAAALAACGGPVLQNAPRPDPAVIAGIAAGVAGAATLADPDAAARHQESKKPDKEKRAVKTKETVPAAVFDRLDSKPKAKPGDATEPVAQPAMGPTDGTIQPPSMQEIKSPIPLKKK